MFGIARLQALHAVATHRTVGRAATALHLTPSAVSQQLATLEREAGTRLTEPAGRGIRLTPAGLVLAEHAAALLERMAAARRDLDRLDEEVVGPLRIGAIPTSAHALAPATLARLRVAHPDLTVLLDDGEAEETMPALLAGDLDLAVVENWEGLPSPSPPGTSRTQLCDDVLDLALPREHPLASRGHVALGELADADLEWVADTRSSRAHDWLLDTLRRAGVEPRVTSRVCGFAIHLELVAGAGLAAMVPRLARPVLPSGVRMLTTTPVLARTVDAVWRSERETPAVRAAVTALRATAAARAPAPGHGPGTTNPDS
ncbi:LysR family transcriptional regulator [Actinomycetospora sp. NBRC 106378]|uniref:LysR family transcriptional regulator n=1 Tax=Actinomycetospora sp. NBRC 106378 TaxID=3032208 RepID=UPI0024A3D31C|nr:LysR family transcriptional regulator [Actinomycetospora sp. NBRC 106378]GLZ52219.1 LysR family transcriptional regulator [Actinomycetospora sp. NBRC 106378]